MLIVYEFDAATIENGAELNSKRIPILINGECERIYHCTPLDDDSIVCHLKTKGSDPAKMAVLKLEYE